MTPLFILATLLCCSQLRAMENDNNNNNHYCAPLPSAPYDSDDDGSPISMLTGLEPLVDAAEHHFEQQPVRLRRTLEEWEASLKKKKMIINLTLVNKDGSAFCSRDMSYVINEDGTCSPSEGWEVIKYEDTDNNPNPANYETFAAFGRVNFQKMMVEKRVQSRIEETNRTTYQPCFQPLTVSLNEKNATILFALTKIVDGQHTLVVPKKKLTVPLFRPEKERYTQTFTHPSIKPFTLEITPGIYSN